MVAGAFARPELAGKGGRLALTAGLVSWDDVVETLNSQGHQFGYARVPAEVFDGFFPGAREVRMTFEYFEAHTYLGPDAGPKIALATEVMARPATSLEDWARQNYPSGAPA
jgi:hypothetical protein